jgi:hypothetical protein
MMSNDETELCPYCGKWEESCDCCAYCGCPDYSCKHRRYKLGLTNVDPVLDPVPNNDEFFSGPEDIPF